MAEYIVSSGITSDGIILMNDSMTVLNGGTANSTTVNDYGRLSVSGGGSADSTTINTNGSMYVSPGGAADTTIINYGSMYVLSGGAANNTTVGSGGCFFVSSGGTATGIVWTPFVGTLQIDDGAIATFADNCSGVYYGLNHQLITHIATLNGTRVSSSYEMYVMFGGTAGNTTVADNGNMYVCNGGTANSTTLYGGNIRVSGGGTANSTTVDANGRLYVSVGGMLNDTRIEDGGYVFVSSGGVANSTTISGYANYRFANLCVYSGGTANNTNIIAENSYLYVYSGGTANSTTFTRRGCMYVYGGVADVTTLNGDTYLYASMFVSSGGTANSTTVNSHGYLYICSGGKANGATVNRYGSMWVSSGGVASNVRINSGGGLMLEGTLTGNIFFEKGGIIYAEGGSVIDFNISVLAPGTTEPLVNDLSLIQGVTYTLTISESQWNGTYTLARGAAGFNSVISVKSSLDGTSSLASLDKSVTVDGVEYTLLLSDDTLSVLVSGSKDLPAIPVSADITEHTNQDVTLTAEFSDISVVREYSFDKETWYGYTGPVKCRENGTVFFLGRDQHGHISETAAYEISNIEKGYTSSGLVLSSGQSVSVSFSEFFVKTTVSSGGELTVLSGGTANETEVDSSGRLVISDGGGVHDTVVKSGGNLYVFNGGTADNTMMNGGILSVSSGTADNTTVNTGGTVYVSSGGTADSTTINSGGSLYVSSGGTANRTTVNSGGSLYARIDGIADSTTVNSGGSLYVSSGGTANHTTVNSGGIVYVSGGGAADGTIMNGGNIYISSGGTATIIDWTPCEGHVFVYDGGGATFLSAISGVYFGSDNQLLSHAATMEGAEVGEQYEMNVMSGGLASKTAVGIDGVLYVSGGGTADGTIMNGGKIHVSSGGAADGTIMNGGNIYISSGGTADGTIMSGGTLHVYSGGTATDILWTPCEGHVSVYNGGIATFVNEYSGIYYGSGNQLLSRKASMEDKTVDRNGEMYIMSDGTANRTTVSSGGTVFVSNGGTATKTSIHDSGRLYVSSGGTATGTTVYSGGSLFVSLGGAAENTTVSEKGRLDILSGGTAHATTLKTSGSMSIRSGGMAEGITISANARLDIASGGTAINPTVISRGSLSMKSGGTALNIVWTPCEGSILDIQSGAVVTFASECAGVYYGTKDQLISHAASVMDNMSVSETYQMIVMNGGTAGYASVLGKLHVYGGGTANNTRVESAGFMHLSSGGTANNTRVSAYGWLYVSSGAVANGTIMDYGGEIHVTGGGTANGTTIFNWGSLHVSSGGAARNTTVNSGGSVYVYKYGSANLVTVNSGGQLTVDRYGVVSGLTVNIGGLLNIIQGGSLDDTTVNAGAQVTIGNGVAADNTTVSSGGRLTIGKGGTARNVTVNTTGMVIVSGGGTLTGRIVLFGGTISAIDGSIVDFDLTQIAPGEAARISDLANITGTPNWTITVNADQAEGIYSLADGAAGFDGTISVVNNSGDTLGTLTVGETTVISDTNYALSLSDDGWLSLKIGEEVSPSPYTSVGLVLGRGTVSVESGQMFYDTLIGPDGKLLVDEGGTASGTIVSGGRVAIGGGTADGTTVCSGGWFTMDGGTADDTTVNSGGSIFVSGGGRASHTIVSGGGFEVSDGSAFGTTVSYGSMLVSAGGTAADTSVGDGGRLTIVSGTADGTNVSSGGSIFVSRGGTANGASIDRGGSIFVSSGGKLTGRMTFETGAVVSASLGAFFEFDLRQTAPGDASLVNDLLCVKGTPFYTITVDGTQDPGTYRLADGITVFNNVISIMNAEGGQMGSLLVGQKLETEYADYTLKVTNGCLTVTVDTPEIDPPVVDTEAPTAPAGLMPLVDNRSVALLWNESTDDISGVKEYVVRYSLNGETFTARTAIPHYVLNDAEFGSYSWSVSAVDFAGNESAMTAGGSFTVSDFRTYVVEYSTDNFEHVLGLRVSSDALDSFRLPTGTYQSRIRSANSADWTNVEQPIVSLIDESPSLVKSDEDGNADVFFANAVEIWGTGYCAQHVGSMEDNWEGTGECAQLCGRNRLADIFEGSTDANILLMTDDDNGDALFVDDIYTASPGNLAETQARIARIDEIRAGAGNDIVDMTSRQFEYVGDGLTIRGGAGDDTIWANRGRNRLFGDAGNDRIVGASGNDVIAGGVGNDRMHGGGGDDVFTFCGNWGMDTVEQLESGSVTLWFANGDESKWNAETLTYTDGENSVRVSGIATDKVTLKFGDDGSKEFAALSGMGAFDAFTSEHIFEESGKGILASL